MRFEVFYLIYLNLIFKNYSSLQLVNRIQAHDGPVFSLLPFRGGKAFQFPLYLSRSPFFTLFYSFSQPPSLITFLLLHPNSEDVFGTVGWDDILRIWNADNREHLQSFSLREKERTTHVDKEKVRERERGEGGREKEGGRGDCDDERVCQHPILYMRFSPSLLPNLSLSFSGKASSSPTGSPSHSFAPAPAPSPAIAPALALSGSHRHRFPSLSGRTTLGAKKSHGNSNDSSPNPSPPPSPPTSPTLLPTSSSISHERSDPVSISKKEASTSLPHSFSLSPGQNPSSLLTSIVPSPLSALDAELSLDDYPFQPNEPPISLAPSFQKCVTFTSSASPNPTSSLSPLSAPMRKSSLTPSPFPFGEGSDDVLFVWSHQKINVWWRSSLGEYFF